MLEHDKTGEIYTKRGDEALQGLRQWILVFCCGCILYGTLENLVPRRGVYPVIKLVFTLYIVLILLSPSGTAGVLHSGASGPAGSISIPQADVLDKTSQALQSTLQNALQQAGLPVQLHAVHLEGSANTLTGVRLCFGAAAPQDQQAAQALCDSLLQMEAAYEWENG